MTSPRTDDDQSTHNMKNDITKPSPDEPMNKEQIVRAAAKLEPPDQAEILSQIVTSVSMQGPFPDPVRSKITEEHISAAIQGASEHDDRQYRLLKQRENRKDSNRWFALAVFVFVLISVALFCIGFNDQPDLLKQILGGLFGFGAGAFAGYGYGQSRRE